MLQISVITVEELEKQYLQDFNACRRDLRLPNSSSVLHEVREPVKNLSSLSIPSIAQYCHSPGGHSHKVRIGV